MINMSATYKQIIEWVKEHHDISTGGCEIAHCKELYGIPVRRSPNRVGTGDYRDNPCPEHRRDTIFDAFRYFNM